MRAKEFIRRAGQAGRQAISTGRGPESGLGAGSRDSRDEAGAVLILALVFLLAAGVVIGSLVTWSSNDLLNTSNLQGGRSLSYSAGGATDVAIQSARYTSPDSLTTPLTAGQTGITVLTDANGLNAPISAGDQVTIGSGATSQTVTATAAAAINATTVSVATFTSTYVQPANTLIYDDACNGTSPWVTIGGNEMSVWCSLVWTPLSASTRVETFSACPSTETASTCTANAYVQAVVTFDDYPTPIGLANTGGLGCTAYCGAGMAVNNWVVK
jgi:hypothetical protein